MKLNGFMPGRAACTTCILFSLAIHSETALAATKGIWITAQEVQALPMSGAAWNNVNAEANGSWGTPDLSNQESKHAASCVAGGLVYMRTGNASLRAKVRDAIIAAKRTMDEDAEYSLARTLGVGRQLVGYAIAADLIDLQTYDPVADSEFRPWLAQMRTRDLPNSNPLYGKTLVRTHECTNGWGLGTGASRIAIDRYIGDTADLARCDSLFRAYSDQRYFPAKSVWFYGAGGDYFIRQGAYEPTWICADTSSWLTISPSCIKTDNLSGNSANIDGAVVSEISREVSGGDVMPFVWPPYPAGQMYMWTALNGLFLQAEMLQRAGYSPYSYGNQALKRAMDFMVRAGWVMDFDQYQYIPWIANRRYGTAYPRVTPTLVPSWSMGWTDWTHATASQVDNVRPAQISDLQ